MTLQFKVKLNRWGSAPSASSFGHYERENSCCRSDVVDNSCWTIPNHLLQFCPSSCTNVILLLRLCTWVLLKFALLTEQCSIFIYFFVRSQIFRHQYTSILLLQCVSLSASLACQSREEKEIFKGEATSSLCSISDSPLHFLCWQVLSACKNN